MFDISKIYSATMVESPFKFSCIQNFLDSDSVVNLLEDLPQEGNYRSSRVGGSDKVYNVVNNILLPLGEFNKNEENQLPPLWSDFVRGLRSKEYREALSHLLDEDLVNCHMEITLKRYKYQDYISAHTDKADVKATHMLFLNDQWELAWGGLLHLMHDSENTLKAFLPTIASSVAFVRSDVSWHKVCPVLQPNKERIAIQVAFWNTTIRSVAPGRQIQVEKY